MRRFLVVGCGGSGGATLAYLMDQLRSDLAAHGVDRLPRGWQFVHIDVPNTSDLGPDGLGSVEDQGGTYFGCGPRAAGYDVLDDAVSSKFAETARLDAMATWAPRHPDKVTNPISDGAGQYRAVGRMISLSRASSIRQALQGAWNQLNLTETDSEMRALTVPGLGGYDPNNPIVLVVSSMAGGAGASMALDVCRLLTTVENLNPKLMGVFMVAPNIFDGLPEAGRTGVRPNALAMLGEIVASQTGSAKHHDVTTLQALGQPGGDGVAIPFARVFPVGRFAGIERTQFGDGSPNAVYRGLGRGLAGLIMSESATSQFVSFDLGNTASPAGDRDLLGWGSDWSPLPWGSYGFASLSMGRDRYAEYSAQRLASSCVHRLLHGHLQRGSQASSNEQVAALLESQWAGLCARAGLPVADGDVQRWLTESAFPRAEVEPAARQITELELRPYVPNPDGVQAAQWVPTLRQRLASRRVALAGAAEQAATVMAYRWHQTLLDRVEKEVAGAVAQLGLPYGIAVAERLSLHVREVVAAGAERLVAFAPADLGAMPQEAEPTLARLKGMVTGGSQLVDQVLNGSRGLVYTQLYARAADLVRQLLQHFSVDVLVPLTQSLSEAQRLLENAQNAEITDRGLARLATDHCAAWPTDGEIRVPSRFGEADNEVLLTSSADFHPQYDADVRRAVGTEGNLTFDEARSTVVGEIIQGLWKTTGGTRPPGGLLERLAQWRSRVFAVEPGTGQAIIPSHTRYDLHVRPVELLGRSRAYVARPGESFNRFCRLSIRDFVTGDDAAESELENRHKEVVERFREALTLARPLISVNNTALQAVHRNAGLEYRYKFSEVPFNQLRIAEDLVRVLQTNPMIDQPSVSNLQTAIGENSGVTRIDVFGSYPNYSPLVFDAVLAPVSEQWAEVGEIGRESFWQWRRARPLNAALPMGDVERRRMVAGWLLGQVLGRIRIPAPPFTQAVQIWNAEEARWIAFPHPLLTPPSRFLADYDWLPAVLESVLLAIACSHQAPVMGSLRPYRLLRGIYDNSSQGPVSGINVLSGRALVAEWLTRGPVVPGGQSAITAAGADSTVDERASHATAWLSRIRSLAGDHYMAPGEDGATGGGAFSVVSRRNQASSTPMFRDVAPDVFWATGELIALVEAERVAAHAAPPPELRPDVPGIPVPDDGVQIPAGGTF